MECSSAWSTGMVVDPVAFFIFVAIVFLACLLGTLLMNVLLGHEDKQLQQAQARIQGSYSNDGKLGKGLAISAFWVGVLCLLFFVGMRHF